MTDTDVKVRKGMIRYQPVVDAVERLARHFGDPIITNDSIESVLVERGIEYGSAQYNRIRQTYRVAKERGTAGIFHVDEICCDVLRKHPAELYGAEWFNA